MNWATKIENFINQHLNRINAYLKSFVKSIIPKSLVKKCSSSKRNISKRLSISQKNIQAEALRKKEELLAAKKRSQDSLIVIKKYGIKASLLFVLGFIGSQFSKVKVWFLNLRPATIITILTFSSVGSLTGINLYRQSKEAAKQRSPASEQVEEVKNPNSISRRPSYYKLTEKEWRINYIAIPTYQIGSGLLKSLKTDITFTADNRYIKTYFWKNAHLVRDLLNTKLEPIQISFPIDSDEGKKVIRDKIRDEMNGLIKSLKIKGQVTKVNLDNILGG